MRTLVLERRERVGGAAETTQLAKGIRVPDARPHGRAAAAVGAEGPRAVAPRALARRAGRAGLRALAGRHRGDALDGRREDGRGPARSLGARRERVRPVRQAGPRARPVPRRARPDRRRRTSSRPGLGDALSGLRLGRSFKGLGRDGSRTVLRVLPMAVADLVAESFESDALRGRARVARRAVRGGRAVVGGDARRCSSAMARATTAARRARRSSRRAARARWRRRWPRRRARRERTIRTSAPVVADHLARRPGDRRRARGRRGDPGAAPSSRALDPKRTLVDLVDPVALGPSLGWRAGNIRTPGVVAKVNLALKKLPVFPAAGGDEALLRGPDRRRARHRRHGARVRRHEVRPLERRTRSSRRRSRRSPIRRSSRARRPARTS